MHSIKAFNKNFNRKINALIIPKLRINHTLMSIELLGAVIACNKHYDGIDSMNCRVLGKWFIY